MALESNHPLLRLPSGSLFSRMCHGSAIITAVQTSPLVSERHATLCSSEGCGAYRIGAGAAGRAAMWLSGWLPLWLVATIDLAFLPAMAAYVARVLLCHGSPRRQNEFLWSSTTPTHFLQKLCKDYAADVIAVTHTGLKWQRELPSNKLFINTGALGRPENDGSRETWYTILGEEGGRIAAEFIPVSYDSEALAIEMRTEGLPEEFAETIETGWWTTCLEILPAKERLLGRY